MHAIIPNWPAPKKVRAFSSTRCGGFSTGRYQGLNLGQHVGDDSKTVGRNRDALTEHFGLPSAPVWLNQTHSTDILVLDAPTEQVLNADGALTAQTGVVCSAMTADCLPVLISNRSGTQVAAVHAGWRGLANGIVENALSHFSEDVMVWLGPAIGSAAFEVGDDVFAAFAAFDSGAEQAFSTTGKPGKWLANMSLLATRRLNQSGVSSVYDANLCTFSDPELFYSYRRDGITGRQASFIWIDD